MININDIKPGHTYKNLKNNKIYRVMDIVTHSESFDTLVIYRDRDYNTWARPLGLFRIKFEKVTTPKVKPPKMPDHVNIPSLNLNVGDSISSNISKGFNTNPINEIIGKLKEKEYISPNKGNKQ